MCELAKQAGQESGDILIESSVAGIQTLKDRDGGFRAGLEAVPAACASPRTRYNNNDINTAASQVNDVAHRQPGPRSGSSPTTTPRAPAPRAPSRTTRPPHRIPVVAFDTDPQENAALKDGSIDALVVQNPYFFGYQGVVQAGMAAVGSQPPLNLDPGAVVADKANMGSPTVKPLLNPPTAKAQ